MHEYAGVRFRCARQVAEKASNLKSEVRSEKLNADAASGARWERLSELSAEAVALN